MKISEEAIMEVANEIAMIHYPNYDPDRALAVKLLNYAAPAIIATAFEEAALSFNTMAKEEGVDPAIATIVESMLHRFGGVLSAKATVE